MTLSMTRPHKHRKTGIYHLRKRVPADLRRIVGRTEVTLSLGTRDPDQAKKRLLSELTKLEAHWQTLREQSVAIVEPQPDGDPHDGGHAEVVSQPTLTFERAQDLASHVGEGFFFEFRSRPEDQWFWNPDELKDLWAKPKPRSTWSIERPPLVGRRQKLWLAEQADLVLDTFGVTTDQRGRDRLIKAIWAQIQRASYKLAAMARGEHVQAEAFRPQPFVNPEPVRQARVPFATLFEGWQAERQPAAKTAYETIRVIRRLVKFLGHDDAARLTADDLVRWKADLVQTGLKGKTIRDANLAPVKAILRWAAQNQKLPSSVGTGVTIDVRKKPGEQRRSFDDDEAKTILRAARQEQDPVLRWAPWICAYSGARVSEVCQIRREDIVQVAEIWCIRIDPKAGSLKNSSSERTIPIHDAILRSGFIEFANTVQTGPLFPKLLPDKFGRRGGNGTKVIGRWVRALGIADLRLAPNHSWRHRFKTVARLHDLAPDIVNAITGHSPTAVGDRYGEYPIQALRRELAKVPDLLANLN